VVVVLGHEAETAQGMIADLPLRIVTNPDYAQGQMTSVHRGLGALEQPGAGVMIGLADQPLIEPADLAELIRAFGEAGPRSVLVPTYAGTRGNPLILAWAHRAAILADVPQLGCKRLVTEHPEWVWPWPMANDHCVVDLDTSADWDHLAKRLSGPNQSAAEPLREA
jgi:molybdenum cofactor cytidylyltransferase